MHNIFNFNFKILQGENVQENVHSIIAAASSKFNLVQFELLNNLIKEKWKKANDRIREKLLLLIGQIGKEAVNCKQVKPGQAILQLLWEMAHIPEIPKHLVERAFAEHLATINEITLNKDAVIITEKLLTNVTNLILLRYDVNMFSTVLMILRRTHIVCFQQSNNYMPSASKLSKLVIFVLT